MGYPMVFLLWKLDTIVGSTEFGNIGDLELCQDF